MYLAPADLTVGAGLTMDHAHSSLLWINHYCTWQYILAGRTHQPRTMRYSFNNPLLQTLTRSSVITNSSL
jgi:hypothetical protein